MAEARAARHPPRARLTAFRASAIRYWEEEASRIDAAIASSRSPTTNLRKQRDAQLRFCAGLDDWRAALADTSWFSHKLELTEAVLARG